MCDWFVNNCIDIFSLLVAGGALIYSIHANKKSKEAEDKVNSIKANIEASNQYSKVKELERPFEDALSKMILQLDSNDSNSEVQRETFFILNNRCADLFNEINSFCALLNNGTIDADEYLKNTATPKLLKYADIQVQCYDTLNKAAVKIGEKKLRKPDYKAFDEFDTFLKNNMTTNQYDNIEKKRKEVGLKF